MKTIWTTALVALGLASGVGMGTIAKAEMRLDPPERLLERAAATRAEYLEVLRDIDKNIPEMRLREEAEMYLNILDELEAIAKAQNRNNLGNTVFKGVSNRLARHALRWVRFEMDPPERVLLAHRYSDPESALDLVQEHRNDLPSITTQEERELMVMNLESLEMFATSAGWPRHVLSGYVSLRSDVALAALETLDKLKEDEQIRWIHHLSPTTGYETFLRSLHERVLTYPQPDPSRFHAYAVVLEEMRQMVANSGASTPNFIRMLLGDVSRDLITAHFHTQVYFTKTDFENLLSNLSRSQLQYFVFFINDTDFALTGSYLNHFLEKGRVLVKRLDELGMGRERDILRKRLDQLSGR